MADEDTMWRHMHQKIEEDAAKKSKMGIQQLDNGFFEKFGSQLKDTADASEAVKDAEKEEHSEYQKQDIERCADLEIPESIRQMEESQYNVEDLYSEIIYEFLHLVGQDATCGVKKDAVFAYLMSVFQIDDSAHSSLLNAAKSRETPKVVLKVEVLEAKNLTPKDANGLSDPYCILWMSSSPTKRYNTDVQRQTLSPTWQDNMFSLETSSASNDVLHLEVWDLDPAETVSEKISKIRDVKGVWGVKKLLKEITSAAYNGQHDNELIGSIQISLKNIPSTGQMAWFNLHKKQKTQGMILLKVMFGSEKDPVIALAEHRHLIRAILLEHVSREEFDANTWDGKFCEEAEMILRQHLAQSNLGYTEDLISKWIEYINVHVSKQINFAILSEILKATAPRLRSGLFNDDEKKLFWHSAKRLLPSCFNFLRRINKSPRKDIVQKLTAIVSIIRELSNCEIPNSVELFPPDVYGWLTGRDDLNIKGVLHEAVVNGACDWFDYLLKRHKGSETDVSKLQGKVKIVDFINIDLELALLYNEQIFTKLVQFPYTKTLFAVYQCRVSEVAEQEVTERCLMMKPIDFEKPGDGEANSDPLLMGTTLFEFYLKLQKLNKIGRNLFKDDYENEKFLVSKYNDWFFTGVVRWLDIAAFKAMQRVERAVDLDDFIPVDKTVQYSSSAVDAIDIFHQVKIFWEQLEWPDVEGCYTFVARIIDDICKCSVHYADKTATKLECMTEAVTTNEKKFDVTDEWCIAINNIDFVHSNIRPLVNQLGLNKILSSLADFKNELAAEHCRQTLELVMNNTVETVGCKIVDLLETVVKKMEPSVTKFLQEIADSLHQHDSVLDQLMQYLDESLIKLKSRLSVDNFTRILTIIWDKLCFVLCSLVQTGIEKRKSYQFFSNVRETVRILTGFFKVDECEHLPKNEEFVKVEKILELYGMDTPDLIHHYYLERYSEQQAMEKATDGIMAVKVQLTEDTIHIEILNAQNIKAMDSNGYCDPYVSLRLLPKHKFHGTKHRTKVQKKTLFPLFDEKFAIHLSPEQRKIPDGLVMFVMKDQDFYGAKNEYMAETFLPFSEAITSEGKQIRLMLHRPRNNDSEVLKALDYRQGDKVAKDFVKRQKTRMGAADKS